MIGDPHFVPLLLISGVILIVAVARLVMRSERPKAKAAKAGPT